MPIGATSRLRVPTVALTVADTGAGMSAEFVAERLFKPFDSTKGSKGMGIGAYQVREYVRSLGGRVDVASVLGQGTRVTLRIPLAGPPRGVTRALIMRPAWLYDLRHGREAWPKTNRSC